MTARSIAFISLMFWAGCRADAGDPDESRLGPIVDPPGFFAEPLPGPDPYVEGEARLSLGIFYEGGYSQLIAIDEQTVHYYIYLAQPSGQLTYRQIRDDDRVEGVVSDRIIHGGLGFWGGGVHFDVARDLRAWQTLHVSLKSSSPAFAEIKIGMNSDGAIETVDAGDYGWAADGTWHTLAIPLTDLADLGVDLGAVTAALTLSGGSGTSADSLKIDDVYFTTP
ncbi:MAG: hypothetical protein U1F43_13055 [Myxococcota bacterium]